MQSEPPNIALKLTPLRGERDRADFGSRHQLKCVPVLSGRRSLAPGVGRPEAGFPRLTVTHHDAMLGLENWIEYIERHQDDGGHVMIDWEAQRWLFEWDGSWRDLYVLDTHLGDWQRLLEHLRQREGQLAFMIDGIPRPLPAMAETIFAVGEHARPFLSLRIDHVQMNCHFFYLDQIEFDIDPREISDPTSFTILLNFMADVGAVLEKEVRLTPENAPDHVLLRYNPAARQIEAG